MNEKVLYFVNGFAPSINQIKEAEESGVRVVFRNGYGLGADHSPEECSAVMGEVPQAYADCPTVGEYLDEKIVEVQAVVKKTRKITGSKKPKKISAAKAAKAKPIEAPQPVDFSADIEKASGWEPN